MLNILVIAILQSKMTWVYLPFVIAMCIVIHMLCNDATYGAKINSLCTMEMCLSKNTGLMMMIVVCHVRLKSLIRHSLLVEIIRDTLCYYVHGIIRDTQQSMICSLVL